MEGSPSHISCMNISGIHASRKILKQIHEFHISKMSYSCNFLRITHTRYASRVTPWPPCSVINRQLYKLILSFIFCLFMLQLVRFLEENHLVDLKAAFLQHKVSLNYGPKTRTCFDDRSNQMETHQLQLAIVWKQCGPSIAAIIETTRLLVEVQTCRGANNIAIHPSNHQSIQPSHSFIHPSHPSHPSTHPPIHPSHQWPFHSISIFKQILHLDSMKSTHNLVFYFYVVQINSLHILQFITDEQYKSMGLAIGHIASLKLALNSSSKGKEKESIGQMVAPKLALDSSHEGIKEIESTGIKQC